MSDPGLDRRARWSFRASRRRVLSQSTCGDRGSVPALIPFLTDKFHLSYALAAMLLLAATVSSSLVQPLFGLWSDRRGALWLIPGGAVLAAVGIGGAAVSPAYPLVAGARARRRSRRRGVPSRGREVRGVRERPEARERHVVLQHRRQRRLRARRVRRPASSSSGSGSSAGCSRWRPSSPSRSGSCAVLPYLSSLKPGRRARRSRAATIGARRWRVLGAVIALRSVAWFTLLAFVPLWVVSLGHSKADGNRLLFLMLLAGALGTLMLGPVADRIGLRRTLVVTQTLIAPLILVFVYVGGVPGVIALMLVGVCVVGTFGVTMVLSQLYLPTARRHGVRPLGRAGDGHRRRGRRRARRRRRRDRPEDRVDDLRDRARDRRDLLSPAARARGAGSARGRSGLCRRAPARRTAAALRRRPDGPPGGAARPAACPTRIYDVSGRLSSGNVIAGKRGAALSADRRGSHRPAGVHRSFRLRARHRGGSCSSRSRAVTSRRGAAAGHPLHGTFTTVVKNAPDDQLDGAWQIALLSNGRYTIQRNGAVLIRGRDTETATTISFGHVGPAACAGALAAATYRWSSARPGCSA